MAIIVRKYGGSSISSTKKIKAIAKSIKSLYEKRNKIVLVVSAMGKTTNDLHELANEITNIPNERELDMLLSIGERKSISLMSIALNAIGVPSVSFTGSQIGIITNNDHGNAKIIEIRPFRLIEELEKNKVIVVAGYQGVSTSKEITTLGRGGTDTTAIALAAAINADRCELMKDVDGLMNLPPKYFKNAHLKREIHINDLKKIVESGAEIVSEEAVEFAIEKSIPFYIGNSETNLIGTFISQNEQKEKNQLQVSITDCEISSEKEAKLAMTSANDTIFIKFVADKKEKTFKLIQFFNINSEQKTELLRFIKSMNTISFFYHSENLTVLVRTEDFQKKLEQMDIILSKYSKN